MSNVKVYDADWQEVLLPGVKWINFDPRPPGVKFDSEPVGNRDVIVSITRQSRMIDCEVLLEAPDTASFKLLRDDFFNWLDPAKQFHIVDFAVSGKCWFGHFMGEYQVERVRGNAALIKLEFYSPLPYAFSRGTTLNDFTYNAELWGYGMGLEYDASKQDYVHNTSTFSIYNAGNQTVDPREHNLKITLKSKGGTASVITLTNITTGDVWRYSDSFANNQTILLDGINMSKNSTNIVGKTNFGVISLAPGNNQFSLTGITGAFEVTFEFNFLYA